MNTNNVEYFTFVPFFFCTSVHDSYPFTITIIFVEKYDVFCSIR